MREYSLGFTSSTPTNCAHEHTRFNRTYTRKKDGVVVEVRVCTLCQKSFAIGGDSRSDKRCRAILELMAGKSYRETSVCTVLAAKMAKKLKDKRPLCGCGKPAGHRFGCSVSAKKAHAARRAGQLNKLKQLLDEAGIYRMGA